jgi:hypothetical protein
MFGGPVTSGPVGPRSGEVFRRRSSARRSRSLSWCSNRGADGADVGGGEHGVEGGDELVIPVADQEPELIGVVAEVDEQVAGLLGDPDAGGVGGDD